MSIDLIKSVLPEGTFLRWFSANLWHAPLRVWDALLHTLWVNYKLTGKLYPINIRVDARQRLRVSYAKGAEIQINGIVTVQNWIGNSLPSSISLAQGSTLIVSGDYIIGPNVHISVSKNALLKIGGQKKSSGSGITSDSRLMVRKKIEVGFDTIIAWGVYITDSEWHELSWGESSASVLIEDNVWIAHDVSVLKGAVIPNGCVVGAKSLVNSFSYPHNSFIAGVPAKVIRKNIKWER